jgi:hypothetical protein
MYIKSIIFEENHLKNTTLIYLGGASPFINFYSVVNFLVNDNTFLMSIKELNVINNYFNEIWTIDMSNNIKIDLVTPIELFVIKTIYRVFWYKIELLNNNFNMGISFWVFSTY